MRNTIVKCPHCGAEYLAGEILYPETIVGEPEGVIRDPLNKILYNEWRKDSEPIDFESYTCDFCDRPFIVEVETVLKTRKKEEELDFSQLSTKLI